MKLKEFNQTGATLTLTNKDIATISKLLKHSVDEELSENNPTCLMTPDQLFTVNQMMMISDLVVHGFIREDTICDLSFLHRHSNCASRKFERQNLEGRR